MAVQITKAEKMKAYREVGKKLAPPRSRGLALLNIMAEYTVAAIQRGKRLIPLSKLVSINRAKSYRSEYQYTIQALHRLKEKDFIEIQKRGNSLMVALTAEGLAFQARERLRHDPAKLPAGTRCYVTFDIPESCRSVRNTLRWELKQADFVQLHKSVWYTNRDVAKYLTEVVAMAGAERWVTILVGTQISSAA